MALPLPAAGERRSRPRNITPEERQAAMFAAWGLAVEADGRVEFVDMGRAETAYVHHSAVPVALAAFASASPAFARGRFPKTRLVDLVGKRPSMDGHEARVLAALGGHHLAYPVFETYAQLRALFAAQLADTIARHHLADCFVADGRGSDHDRIRPLGWSPAGLDAAGLRRFAAVAKTLSASQRILLATIVCLYRGAADTTWLKGKEWGWHAADAVATLRAVDAVAWRDWTRLVALYPGW